MLRCISPQNNRIVALMLCSLGWLFMAVACPPQAVAVSQNKVLPALAPAWHLADLYFVLGTELASQGALTPAKGWLEKALKYHPQHNEALLNYGIVLYRMKKLPEAERVLSTLLQRSPNDVHACYYMVWVANEQDKIEQAISTLQHLISLEPHVAMHYYDLGVLWSKQENYLAAAQATQKAIDLGLNEGAAYNNLAYSLAYIQRLPEALSAVEKALSMEPENAATLDTKGFIFYKMGQHQPALLAYNKALLQDPTLGEIYKHKAEALEASGSLAEAIRCYQLYLQWSPGEKQRLLTEQVILRLQQKLKAQKPSRASSSASIEKLYPNLSVKSD